MTQSNEFNLFNTHLTSIKMELDNLIKEDLEKVIALGKLAEKELKNHD